MQLMLVGSIFIMGRKGKYSDQDISRRTHSAASETNLDKGQDTFQGMQSVLLLSSAVKFCSTASRASDSSTTDR